MNGKGLTVIAGVILGLISARGRPIRAQDIKTAYPRMAPIGQYLDPDRNAEVALARSAAPDSISRDAKILVLGSRGYQPAVEGKNGFVCLVERSWMLPLDNQEFWNPKVRLPLCINSPGSRSHLPLTYKSTALALARLSKQQMSDAIKAAYDNKELPPPEHGSMCYMMSKQQYFGDKVGNAGDSHLMFWFPQEEHMVWGAEGSDSPVNVHQYSPQPVTEFTISISKWSDGTRVPVN